MAVYYTRDWRSSHYSWRSRGVASMCTLHLYLKTASVALLTLSHMCWIELSWQATLLLQRCRTQRAAGEAGGD